MNRLLLIICVIIIIGTLIVAEKCNSNFWKEYKVADTLRIKAIPVGIVGSKYARLQIRDIKDTNKFYNVNLPSKLYSEKDTLDVMLLLNSKGVFLQGEIIN